MGLKGRVISKKKGDQTEYTIYTAKVHGELRKIVLIQFKFSLPTNLKVTEQFLKVTSSIKKVDTYNGFDSLTEDLYKDNHLGITTEDVYDIEKISYRDRRLGLRFIPLAPVVERPGVLIYLLTQLTTDKYMGTDRKGAYKAKTLLLALPLPPFEIDSYYVKEPDFLLTGESFKGFRDKVNLKEGLNREFDEGLKAYQIQKLGEEAKDEDDSRLIFGLPSLFRADHLLSIADSYKMLPEHIFFDSYGNLCGVKYPGSMYLNMCNIKELGLIGRYGSRTNSNWLIDWVCDNINGEPYLLGHLDSFIEILTWDKTFEPYVGGTISIKLNLSTSSIIKLFNSKEGMINLREAIAENDLIDFSIWTPMQDLLNNLEDVCSAAFQNYASYARGAKIGDVYDWLHVHSFDMKSGSLLDQLTSDTLGVPHLDLGFKKSTAWLTVYSVSVRADPMSGLHTYSSETEDVVIEEACNHIRGINGLFALSYYDEEGTI